MMTTEFMLSKRPVLRIIVALFYSLTYLLRLMFLQPVAKFRDYFQASWKAFTNKDPVSLYDFGKKRVCFSEVIFSLLPRMPEGLYYPPRMVSMIQLL